MDQKGKVVRLRPPSRGPQQEGAQAIDRALSLLVLVSQARDEGASLSQLVEQSGLKQPTAHRLLSALSRAGLVEQDSATKRYHLGYESYVIGTLAADRFGIHRFAQGSVARLAHLSQDTGFFTIRRGNFSVCLHREEGDFPIRSQVLSVGDRHPLGIGAGSIAILAALGDDEVEAVLEANTDLYRERYPTVSPALLRQLVKETRRRGFATHRGLVHPGSWGIGVVVRDELGQPSAALSIGAIEHRLVDESRQEALAALMQQEADKVQAQLSTRANGKGKPDPRRGAIRQAVAERAPAKR